MNKSRNTNRRPQAAKNTELSRAMQELRKGSRTEPRKNKARYSRSDRRDTSYKNGY